MFAFLTILAALGIILALIAIPMLAFRKGSPLLLGRSLAVLVGAEILALVVYLAGDEAAGDGGASRWSSNGAQSLVVLAIALGVVAVALLQPTIRGRDGKRLIAGSGAVVSLAAFVFLWFMAVVHTLNLS